MKGNCEWFTNYCPFRAWLERKDSSLLLVTAPGCGKQSHSTTSCFFKDGFKSQRSAKITVCCLLRQVFDEDRTLLSEGILERFKKDGERLLESSHGLWDIVVEVGSLANKEIICILDALSECEEIERGQLIQILTDYCRSDHTGRSLKFLVTSPPHETIGRHFKRFQRRVIIIHLHGEDEGKVKEVEKEIDMVIDERMYDLGDDLPSQARSARKVGISAVTESKPHLSLGIPHLGCPRKLC